MHICEADVDADMDGDSRGQGSGRMKMNGDVEIGRQTPKLG